MEKDEAIYNLYLLEVERHFSISPAFRTQVWPLMALSQKVNILGPEREGEYSRPMFSYVDAQGDGCWQVFRKGKPIFPAWQELLAYTDKPDQITDVEVQMIAVMEPALFRRLSNCGLEEDLTLIAKTLRGDIPFYTEYV